MKYQMNKIYNEDCLQAMKQMPDNYFELAIIDPPYGIDASKPSIKPEFAKQKNGNYLKVKNTNKYKHKDWDNSIPSKEYFDELIRISKNQIIWGVNYFNNYNFGNGRIVWDKLNGLSDQFDGEICYQSFNNRVDIVYYMWQGMFQGLECNKDINKALIQKGNKKLNEKRIHPTQKPVALYEWLLKNYAKKGDKILDTHLGSGSSIIACKKLGFEYMAFELDKDYYNATKERIAKFDRQGNFFDLFN